jgi:uncharacterized protein YjbI with pentapeptide repeats
MKGQATMADMTREQLLQKIQRGEKVERADLRGLNLANARLPKAALNRADLDGANLESADLSGASLRRASLREAYLVGINLTGADLENADLEEAKLERAVLAGANLTRANLEGAVLTGADLSGAVLSHAQLAAAKLGGANLAGAVFIHAQLDEAYLGAVHAEGANLTKVSLVNANLEEALLSGAMLNDATLRGANLRLADLSGASMVNADLSGADLSQAKLDGVDARHAILTGAQLTGSSLTGARVSGLIGTGAPLPELQVGWLDASSDGNGERRVENGAIAALLTGRHGHADDSGAPRRYFGRGDVLRNAILQFDAGARVEIDSLFQDCTIKLGDGTELVVGAAGVLADCEILGSGNITVHGKFFERRSPGIVGPRRLVVSSQGVLVTAVAQNEKLTRFSFAPGCQLRVKIVQPAAGQPTEKSEATA